MGPGGGAACVLLSAHHWDVFDMNSLFLQHLGNEDAWDAQNEVLTLWSLL